MKESDYRFEIRITDEQGRALKVKPVAVANSCFWRDIKLCIFSEGTGKPLSWCAMQLEDFVRDQPVNPDYGRIEGLRDQFEIPPDIVNAFKEALGCYANGYYNSSAVMARRLLERTLIEKGAQPNQRVCDMIKDLVSRGIIDAKLKDLCDEIKSLGNVGAHAKEEEVNQADAQQALHFSDFLISWLFGTVEEMPSG